MPSRRVTAETQDYWSRMRNTGLLLRDDRPVGPPALTIEQAGGRYDSQIYRVPPGVTCCVCWVRIEPLLSGSMICGWEIKPPDPDPALVLLDDPHGVTQYDLYVFPCGGGEFQPTIVLNHRVDRPLTRPMEGALLATGRNPIPEKYRHGSIMEIDVSVFLTGNERYTKKLQLWVNRVTEIDAKSSRKPTHSSLFKKGVSPGATTVPNALGPTPAPGVVATGVESPRPMKGLRRR